VELQHWVAHEWVRSADDALWRRSKLGLHLTPSATAAVHDWLQRHGRATLG
jgi:glycerol-3-phosphate dehydrogenase